MIRIDAAAVRAIAAGLDEAGTDFDSAASKAPAEADAGIANAAIANLLASLMDCAIRLAAEPQELASRAGDALSDFDSNEGAAIDGLHLPLRAE
ncbi:hypothetical protein [Demequina globuliformis]|uniref:hypothetical protein n=1 Tax=Demequina globuliformis TaxID=676202 RepID=UPI000785C271|nr:hypothetical protein [Demequina globuliformis]